VVRGELPGTRITYISIKPSPSRAALLPRVREANQLLQAYVRTLDNAEYIDIFNPMMTAGGMPRPELFLPDQLHMNDQGYALWQSVIARHLALPANASQAAAALPATAAVATQAARLSAPR
jgi:lysophospholipase L1-like esterase